MYQTDPILPKRTFHHHHIPIESIPLEFYAIVKKHSDIALQHFFFRSSLQKIMNTQEMYTYFRLAKKTILDWKTLPFQSLADLKKNSETFPYRHLDLARKNLKKLPENFLKNTQELEMLDLTSTQLELLPINFLQKAPKLQDLSLNGNQLQSLSPNFLEDAPQLQNLSLSDNKLEFLPPTFLQNAPELISLHLPKNMLQSLPKNFLKKAGKLQILNLSHNKLQSLPPGFLNRLPPALKLFDLRKNPLNIQTKKELKEFKKSHQFPWIAFDE